MSICLKNCKFIVTQDANRQILENQDILIKENKIVRIGSNLKGAKQIDCSQSVVIPGLINLHTHTGMYHLRGLSDDLPYKQWWEQVIWPAEHKMTPQDKHVAAKAAIKEMLQTGTTCFVDMYEEMEAVADAAKEQGIRAVLAYGIIDINNEEKAKIEWQRTEDLLKYINELNCSRIKFAVGPHTPFTCSQQSLLKSQEFAQKHNALVHIHLSEDKRNEFPERLIQSNVIAAHCCHLSDGDIQLFAERGANIAHCPRSNMKLASGILPLKKLLAAGICVGLGTDSTVSNNNLDMFEEMHFAALLQKVHFKDATAATAQMLLDMATINGAKAAQIDAGSIEPGKLADLVLLDADHFLMQPSEKERIVSHLVYSANGSCVQTVIIDGKLVQL
jgi:5-methylthioadenosine/S-adenosylhomocysteine deaminase